MSYIIKFTDTRKAVLTIDDTLIDQSTDVALFGRKRLAYGELIQENLLHILENFSCPEDSANPGNPDLNTSYQNIFQNPIEGQCWYNSTKNVLNFYDGTHWIPLSRKDGIAANWGMIYDGGLLPNPVNSTTGRVFDYNECVWIVSPQSIPTKIDYYVCNTTAAGKVSMKYRQLGSDVLTSGIANYLIVGIEGNVNQPEPPIQISPTPSVTPTTSVGQSLTPTPTVSPTRTPANTPTPTGTPQPSVSSTPIPSPTRTPAATTTPTPTNTVTPSPVPATLPINGKIYDTICAVPLNTTGAASISFSMNSTSWQIAQYCRGTTTYSTTGSIPSNAYTAEFVLVYRPDLSLYGGSPSPGTTTNSAPTATVIAGNTLIAGITTPYVSGNSASSYFTTYTVQIILRDVYGNIISNSTTTFDADVVGSA